MALGGRRICQRSSPGLLIRRRRGGPEGSSRRGRERPDLLVAASRRRRGRLPRTRNRPRRTPCELLWLRRAPEVLANGRALGTVQGILRQDLLDSQDLSPRCFSRGGSFRFDLLLKGGNAPAVLLVGEMSPARNFGEDHGFFRRILERAVLFSATAGRMLLAAVEPVANQRSACEQRLNGMDAGPILKTFDKLLFNGLAEDVPQDSNLCDLLLGDDRHFVAALED